MYFLSDLLGQLQLLRVATQMLQRAAEGWISPREGARREHLDASGLGEGLAGSAEGEALPAEPCEALSGAGAAPGARRSLWRCPQC